MVVAALSNDSTASARNAQRQLASTPPECEILAMSPLSTGETKPAPVSAAAHTEIACERWRTVCVPAASIAIEVGKIAAAPRPDSTCPVHNCATRASVDPDVGVRNAITHPIAMSTPPAASSRLRPNRSPITPKVSSNRVTGTRNASEIQVSWVEDVPRSSWNSPLSTAGSESPIWATATAVAAAISVPGVSRSGRAVSPAVSVGTVFVVIVGPSSRGAAGPCCGGGANTDKVDPR